MIEELSPYKIQIIETLLIVLLIIIVKLLSKRSITKILNRWHFDEQRSRMSMKIINIFIFLGAVILLGGVWNIDQTQLMVFITSMLTVMGIAFFAQWSILSNITSSLILFFNHPLRIGDSIEVIDKELSITGKLEDISFFFMHIRTEQGDLVTIPNNLVLQKIIKSVKQKD
jgi:small-conductance mechanosensitive channel